MVNNNDIYLTKLYRYAKKYTVEIIQKYNYVAKQIYYKKRYDIAKVINATLVSALPKPFSPLIGTFTFFIRNQN